VAGAVKTVVLALLVILAAGATGVLGYFGRNPGAMPAVAKRRKVLGGCAGIVAASVSGLPWLGPGS
jgi:hypothetical protein